MRIIGYVSRGVRLLVAPWRASSQSIWHLNVYHKGSVALFHCFKDFFCCFLSSLVPLVRPVSSWRMGWSPPLSTTSSRKDRPRWPRPKVVCLAGHLGVFQYWVKQGDTVKATTGIRLEYCKTLHNIVDAGRRLLGAFYLRALLVI